MQYGHLFFNKLPIGFGNLERQGGVVNCKLVGSLIHYNV